MKQNVGSGILIGAVALVLIVVGVIAYRLFFTDPNATQLQGKEGQRIYMENRAKDADVFKRVREQQARGVPPDQIK